MNEFFDMFMNDADFFMDVMGGVLAVISVICVVAVMIFTFIKLG